MLQTYQNTFLTLHYLWKLHIILDLKGQVCVLVRRYQSDNWMALWCSYDQSPWSINMHSSTLAQLGSSMPPLRKSD